MNANNGQTLEDLLGQLKRSTFGRITSNQNLKLSKTKMAEVTIWPEYFETAKCSGRI